MFALTGFSLRLRTRDLLLLRSGLAYLVVGAFVASQFVLQGLVSLMVPELKADLGLTETGVGMLASLFFYPYVILQIPAGWVLPRLGVRNLLAIAALVMSTGCFAESIADSVFMAMVGRCLMGVGAAPGIVCFLSTVGAVMPARYFGLFAATTELFGMVGAGVGDFLIPSGIRSCGWQCVLEWFGYGVLALSLLSLALPGKLHQDSDSSDDTSSWKNGLNNSNVWLVGLYSGLMFAVLNAFAALWAIPFLETHGACRHNASDMAGMIFLGAAVGAPFLGWISDVRGESLGIMLVCSIVTSLLFMMVLYDQLPTIVYYLIMFCLGLSSSSYMLPFMMVKRWLKGQALATGMALTNTVSVMVGALVYQPLIGWLLGFYPELCLDSYRQVLLLIPAGMVISIVLLLGVKNHSAGCG